MHPREGNGNASDQSSRNDLIDNWLVTPGQCLLCGGRGGYPSGTTGTETCSRCAGTGRDPARGEGWFMDVVLPVQIEAAT